MPRVDRRRIAGLVLGLVALHAALALPNRLDLVTPTALLRLPVELPLVVVLLLLLPGRWRQRTAVLLGVVLALVVALKLADMAAYAALARPFNPILDTHLAAASRHLLQGAIGTLPTLLAAVALVLTVGATAVALVRALATLGRALPASPLVGSGASAGRAAAILAALAVAGGLGVTAAAHTTAVSAETSQLVHAHGRFFAGSLRDLRAFREEARHDPFAHVASDRLLQILAGKDVLLVFVESYGRSALEHPLYAPTILPTLDRFAQTLEARGYHARSGWVTAPMVGGQSWLAHASMLSGLWIDNQRRYRSLLATDRTTLIRDFARAGWETAAVMPAITMAWPEGAFFGYDRIHAAADLGYRGEPFNWVTMPDQYTMAALNRLELDRDPRGPVFAEIALISSHAPWVPIPPVIAWDEVGDGSVFTPYALSGDPPRVVWQDPDRVRAQYLKAVDYALQNLDSYVAHFGRDDLLLIVLGDHQPAPIVTGPDASFDVPIHLLSRDPAVIEAIEPWGWTPGMRPDADVAPWRMDAFRGRLLEAFTPGEPLSADTLPPRVSRASLPATR